MEFPLNEIWLCLDTKMSGECGKKLKIDLLTTDVDREKKWEFPYQGYGFACADKSILALTLKQ